MKTLRRTLHYMGPYWHLQSAALLCALVVTASGFIWPFANKWLVDAVLMPGHTRLERLATLRWVAEVTLAAMAVNAIFGLARSYLFARAGEGAAADLRRDLFRHLHRLPMAFFDGRKTGGIMSVVQNDVEAVQGLYSNILVDVISSILTAVVAVGILVYYSPRLTLEGMPVPIVFALVLAFFGGRLHRAGRKVREDVGGVQEVLQESVSGAREVKAFVRAGAELGRYLPKVFALVGSRVRQSVLGSANWSVANLVAWSGMTVVMVLASLEVIYDHMSPGEAVLFINTLAMLFGPASTFVTIFSQVAGALGAADRIFEFQDTPVEVQAVGARPLPRARGRVTFDDVCFQYDDDGPQVLCDINIEAEPGEMIALVGPSGAGKTTLVSLLPRLYDVTSGRILIDGTDIRAVTLASLRAQIAFVPQEPFLFGTTAKENIRFGREGASDEEVIEAAKAANAHEFVAALPDGYDTEVGERGTRLSVGQKQRIAIARAILRDPRILILDEATSAQDSESERLVQEAMRRLMEGRTSFAIAHRLSTVLRADRIVVLDAGRVSEVGTHAELLRKGGIYSRLHSLQFSDGPRDTESAVAGSEA
jgi:subfamily B ATP-binding cassette protein MsbA